VFVVFGLIFQMFKVWEGIPSLQGVSDTIVIAGKGLMSFSLVIVCLVTLFAGAGMLAFGQQMEEFHDGVSAFITTLLIMTKGDADVYQRQYEIDPVFSSIWHWLLVCIMYLVCLNLILCILVDAYGEAHSAHENADRLTMPSLMEQSWDTFSYYSMELWADAKKRASVASHNISSVVTGRSVASTARSTARESNLAASSSSNDNRGKHGKVAPAANTSSSPITESSISPPSSGFATPTPNAADLSSPWSLSIPSSTRSSEPASIDVGIEMSMDSQPTIDSIKLNPTLF
jgi:hypothetical protein